MIPVMLQVVYRAVITFTESLAEVLAGAFIYRRVLVDIMIIGIGMAMVGEVAAGSFNALMEAAALGIAVCVGWLVPAITILILR